MYIYLTAVLIFKSWPIYMSIFIPDLNSELEDHDDILNRLDDKAGQAGIKVNKQNKDMAKMLKK